MPFVSLPGFRLCYELHGSGPRLLTISGSGSDLRRPPGVLNQAATNEFELLAYDHRGQGRSSAPPGPWTMKDFADDAAALLDALGWERCLVRGTSFGGMVAQEFALRYPHRVERLALLCTSSGGAGGSSYPIHRFGDLSAEAFALAMLEVSDTRRDEAWKRANPGAWQSMRTESVAAARIGGEHPGRREALRLLLEARSHHDTWSRLPALAMPVAVFGGRYDGIATPDNLKALAARIPGATLEFFEGGHVFFQQDPRAAGRILAFLLGRTEDSA